MLNETKRRALKKTLEELQARLDYLVSSLDSDEEFIALLRSAAEKIKSAIEQLAS